MNAVEVLKAMADDGQLAEDVLKYLSEGIWEEWDTDLAGSMQLGFGPPELAIAARTAAGVAEYHYHKREQS